MSKLLALYYPRLSALDVVSTPVLTTLVRPGWRCCVVSPTAQTPVCPRPIRNTLRLELLSDLTTLTGPFSLELSQRGTHLTLVYMTDKLKGIPSTPEFYRRGSTPSTTHTDSKDTLPPQRRKGTLVTGPYRLHCTSPVLRRTVLPTVGGFPPFSLRPLHTGWEGSL